MMSTSCLMMLHIDYLLIWDLTYLIMLHQLLDDVELHELDYVEHHLLDNVKHHCLAYVEPH
jgi:hypothetical protein